MEGTIQFRHSEIEMSFWRNSRLWLHRKLSKWQLPVQPVSNVWSKSQCFLWSVCFFGQIFSQWIQHDSMYRESTRKVEHMADLGLELIQTISRPPERDIKLPAIYSLYLNVMPTCWRHQMETLSALLAICTGNSPVPGEFPVQRPVTRSLIFLWSASE